MSILNRLAVVPLQHIREAGQLLEAVSPQILKDDTPDARVRQVSSLLKLMWCGSAVAASVAMAFAAFGASFLEVMLGMASLCLSGVILLMVAMWGHIKEEMRKPAAHDLLFLLPRVWLMQGVAAYLLGTALRLLSSFV